MSDTMWVDVNEVVKSYKAAGMECHVMSDKRPTDTLIVRENEQMTFTKWHDISVGLKIEVDDDFFELWPQHAKTREQLQAELAGEAKAFSNLYANYTGARAEIKELKEELENKTWLLRKFKTGHEARLAEFKEMQQSWEDATRLTRLQSETIRRLRGLCGEAADWMKNEIIHESEEETELREQLDMASHR